MNDKLLSALTRIAILIIGICGLLSCLLWIPISIGNGTLQHLPWESLSFLIQYVFHWIVSLPCFVLLFFAWKITSSMNSGKLFLQKNAVYASYASIILAIDISIFLIGNILFSILGWSNWILLHILIAVIGLVVSIFMYVLSKYLIRAALLQEESDFTV